MSVKRKKPENDDDYEEKEAKEPKHTIRNTTIEAFLNDVHFFLNYLINYQNNVLEGTFDAWKNNNILGSDLLEEIKTNHEITFDSRSFIEKEDQHFKILNIDIFLVFTRKIFKKHSITTWCRLYDNVSYEEDTGYIKFN